MSASEVQVSGVQPVPMTAKKKGSAFIAQAPEGFADPAPSAKWSGRKTLVFIVLTCGVAWVAIIAGIMALF